uniref:Odorant receptor n=1 Tax=Anopheles melas TaxID=34690 RepID=A0A182U524_9DIPT
MYLTQLFASKRTQFLHRITHYTEHSDFFIMQRYFEKIYAIHYTPRGWHDRILWYLYRAMYGLIYLSYIHKTHWVLNHPQDSFSTANILGVMWFFSVVILRVAILEWYYPLMLRMQTFLNDHTSYQRTDPWTVGRRARFYRRTNRVILAVTGINLAETVCFTATNVMKMDEFMLQFRGAIVGGWPVQIVYGVLTMGFGGMYCMGFMICYLLLSIFKLEVDILIHSLEEYYSTYLIIADCCLILVSHGLSSFSIVYFISMLVFLTESFLLCRGVENLRDLKPRIASTVYDFDWMLQMRCTNPGHRAQYRHIRRTLLLLTAQSDQTIQFSFAGIGEISMNSFGQLLEKSYSMLTFLLQFAK